jgi:hypothetical protein
LEKVGGRRRTMIATVRARKVRGEYP